MKKIFFLATVTLLSLNLFAQVKFPGLDKSPMDMSYCPANYMFADTPGTLIGRIIYSRPQKKDGQIFGGLVPYKEVWRLGANEATELDFFQPVTIGGKKIAAGRYTLYTIPDSLQWTMILSTTTDTWGAFSYDAKYDVVRVDVPVRHLDSSIEALSIVFNKTASGSDLVMAWDKTEAILPVAY